MSTLCYGSWQENIQEIRNFSRIAALWLRLIIVSLRYSTPLLELLHHQFTPSKATDHFYHKPSFSLSTRKQTHSVMIIISTRLVLVQAQMPLAGIKVLWKTSLQMFAQQEIRQFQDFEARIGHHSKLAY